MSLSGLPTFAEIIFAAILFWLFVAAPGAKLLLRDGDTGWHIRTGEYILSTGSVPQRDMFSFSRPEAPWFAWEWLTDVLLALLQRAGGLSAVVLLCGVLIAATSALLFQYMLWRGCNPLAALMTVLVAASASSVHWLARPHLLTGLFLLISIWLLEVDRRRPTPWVFSLVPIAILWTNLHGGFVSLPIVIGAYLIGIVCADRRSLYARRYTFLLLLVAAATFVNPYMYHLHQHVATFLGSEFILALEAEFKSPNFHKEEVRFFEALLFGGLIAVPSLWRRREIGSILLLLLWAHAAVTSMRHIPLFAIVAAPIIAERLSALCDRWFPSPKLGAAISVGWLPAVCLLVLGFHVQQRDFPTETFPVVACDRLGDLTNDRVFTTEHWGGYLIWRYPHIKVFIDGRSDFYGPSVCDDYLEAQGGIGWEETFDRYCFNLAIIPKELWLAQVIAVHPGWKQVHSDETSVVFGRQSGSPSKAPSPSCPRARASGIGSP